MFLRRCCVIPFYIYLISGGVSIIAFVAGYFLRKNIAEGKIQSAEELAKKIVSEAEKEAESKRKNLL